MSKAGGPLVKQAGASALLLNYRAVVRARGSQYTDGADGWPMSGRGFYFR